MAREPELSIKVKVDPQINPSSLKTNIERQVKQSGEKPQIEIDPNVDGIKGRIEEKLKNVKATAIVTPVVDTEKIKTDIQQQINDISDMPKVTVSVDVNNFSNELSEQLKTQLKEVNQQLNYYLKNLTTNTTSLNDVTKNLFVDSNFAERLQKQVDEVRASFNALKSDLGESNSFFDNIFARTDLKSFNDFQIKIAKLKKELEPLYGDDSILADPKTKLYDSTAIKKYFEDILPDVQEFVQLLNNISYVPKNTKLLKELGISQEEMKKTLADAQVMYNVITKIRNYAEAGNFNADKYNLSEQIENIVSKAYDANDIDIEDFENLFQGVVNNISNVSKLVSDRLEEVADKKRKVLESDDKSRIGGYDESRIKKISDTYLEALSAFTNQQNVLNKAKAATIKLDDTLLAKASAHAKAIKNQASDIQKIYGFVSDDILNSKKSKVVDSKNGDAKNTNSVESNFVITNVDFKIDPAVLQAKVDALFNGISAPISKVTITDADIAVDVKNPVKIPSVAVIDSSAAQVSNTDDLKASADALASANKSLNGIASKTDRYVSNISALGPAFQYVAQEVDNLSHSLENQIIDLDRISEQTNAYIGKAGSISIDTSNVAVTGEPAAITGKVVLGTEDVVSPETPVDIKGHVELKITDITPPSEPVELQGKIAKTTMESTAKGKKKKGQDVEKPDVVELAGRVKLEDKDIERPDPVVMNGKVVVTKNNIKLPEGGIDVKGNLILKNAEIANAIKEAAGKESGKKDASAASGNETNEKSFNRAGKEARLGYLVAKMGENDTYWQSAISKGNSKKRALYARKSVELEKDFEDTTRELIENLTDEEKNAIEAIKKQKINWNDTDSLLKDKTISWPWEESKAYLDGVNKAASGVELYNASETDQAKKRNNYEKEYVELIKQKPALIKAAAEAKKQYGEDSDAYKDAARAKKENEEALHAINPDRKKVGAPRGSVGGGYSNSPAVQSALADIHKQVQKRRSELLLQKTKDSKNVNDKQTQQAKKILSDAFIEQVRAYADGLKESSKYNDDDVSESAKTARKQMQDAFDSANDKFLELLDVFSGDEIDQLTLKAKKELDSANRIVDRRIANLTDNNNKQNLSVEDRQKALDQIRAAIEKNANNMDRARKNGSTGSDLYSQFNAKQTMYKALEEAVSSGSGVKDWAKTYFPAKVDDINNVTDALREMRGELSKDQIELAKTAANKSIERSTNKAATAVANLKSQIHDYLETNKKIQNSELAQPFRELMNALNSENAPEKIGELQKQFAELRARSKELGLETESLIDKFEKLFGTHLSTMITMAALHKMQEALRLVYQNVVEIDTALIELRKVSELSGKSLEEYMGRAAEQAQNLGVSISDYISSTADWKRLGYSDEDAENMATYSTLLKNVGDGIDDVNTSSSYLISTLQGFGLLAKDAESVVDQIDKVANTQPITAQAIGEILTRSAASMKAANNDLAETISLGTAAYAVIQNAETVGTTLKSVSMYLRAAKSELEDAGESADGCANSVSELRSELKSLTGVDIMIDNKNFKSTYQILKELSQVWDGLSDVTQANVTEMIGGKRNANAVSALLNNFQVAEDSLEAAANSAGTAWAENDVWMDSIQARLAQLDASFQALSEDVLSSGLVKGSVSFLSSIVKLLDKIVNLTGALPAGLGIATFATQLGEPKMTGFMIVPSNTPGGDTEQVLYRYFVISLRSMREYLVKPTNMAA